MEENKVMYVRRYPLETYEQGERIGQLALVRGRATKSFKLALDFGGVRNMSSECLLGLAVELNKGSFKNIEITNASDVIKRVLNIASSEQVR